MEIDNDLNIDFIQFRYRVLDPQIGRFLEVDPLASKYTHNATYAYAENKTINGIDLEGLEHLNTTTSIIMFGPVRYNASTGEVTSSLLLREANISSSTKAYIENTPWASGQIGSGKNVVGVASSSYQEQMETSVNSQKPQSPEMKDVEHLPSGVKPVEGYLPNIPNNKKEMIEQQNKKNFYHPIHSQFSTKSGLAAGTAFLVTTDLIKMYVENRQANDIGNDYQLAGQQANQYSGAILKAINFGIRSGLIPKNMQGEDRLQSIANYALYGRPESGGNVRFSEDDTYYLIYQISRLIYLNENKKKK